MTHKARFVGSLRRLGASTLVALTLALGSTPALANSITATSPTSGAVLGIAPNAVSVTGTTALSEQGSTIAVTDPHGSQVDDGSVTISDTTAVIGLKPLTTAGVYTVTYSLVSATDAPLTGSYTFLFNAPATVTSSSPTPIASATPAAGKGTHTADIFVIILMVFAIFVGIFLLWYARMLLREWQAKKRKSRAKSAARSSAAARKAKIDRPEKE